MAGWDKSRPRLSTARTRPVSQQASRQVVPVGKVIWIRKDGDPRELLLVAYVQTAGGARFTMAGPSARSPRQMTRGASYQVGFRGWHAAGELLLRADPPHEIGWLDLTTAPGEPPTPSTWTRTAPRRMSP
jgi:hypothetical protein